MPRRRLVALTYPFILAAACSNWLGGEDGGFRTRWLVSQPGYSSARPAVSGGVVFLGSGAGISARDARNGGLRWNGPNNLEPVDGASLLVSGNVLVVPMSHHTAGLNIAGGGERWRYAAPPDLVATGDPNIPGQVDRKQLAVDAETAYIPAWGASVSAVDLTTGEARWVWQPGVTESDTSVAGRFRSGAEGVVVAGDTVYVAAWHFRDRLGLASEPWLVALDKQTGAELWRLNVPSFTGGVCVLRAPVVYEDLVMLTARGGHTWAVDRFSTEVVWSFTSSPTHSTRSGAALHGDALYLDVGDGHIAALGAADGALRWKSPIGGAATPDLLVTERRVYVPWGQRMSVLDRVTGKLVREFQQPGSTYDSYFASAPAAANGQVFTIVDGAAWSFDEP